MYFWTEVGAEKSVKYDVLTSAAPLRYNRALSSNEVAAIYAAGAGGKCKEANITVQPQSQTVAAGTNVLLTVSATGFGTLSYQWQFNGAGLSGATGTSLALSSVQPANSGSYTVVVSNTPGSVTSAVAVVDRAGAPAITGQPTSLSVAVGANASFTVTAAGTLPLSYQWQFNGADVAGATGTSLMLANVQTNNAGSYQVVVTNSMGSATSAVASLTVGPPSNLLPKVPARWCWSIPRAPTIWTSSISFSRTWTTLASLTRCWTSSTNAPGPSISNYAVIIIGHSQLDTNHTYLNAAVQANLSLAVSNGTGLVSFDNDLYSGSTPRYQFVQDIFGFSYGSGASGTSVTLPPTEPSSQMHYITARHPTNDLIAFRASISLPGITVPTDATTLAQRRGPTPGGGGELRPGPGGAMGQL